MADLQCRLQETVNANRETLNNRAEDRRIKEEVTQSKQQQPGTAQAKRGSTAPPAGDTAKAQRTGTRTQSGGQQVKVSQQQALEAAGKKVGQARLAELKKQLSARRDVDGLLEPIYILQYGDDTQQSYATVAGSVLTRPDQTLLVYRGDTLISAIQPMSTVPFDLSYAEYDSRAYGNAIAAINSFGGSVAAEFVSAPQSQWYSFKVNGYLSVDQKLIVSYCRGVRIYDRNGFMQWRKDSWPPGLTFVNAYLTSPVIGPSYVYFDFVTYEVDLIGGGVQGISAPFLQYKIESQSARVIEQTVTGQFGGTVYGWVEQTYGRTVNQRKPSVAMAETLGATHPAKDCDDSFWDTTEGFELLPISGDSGVIPELRFGQLYYELLYGPPYEPDDYIAGIVQFPSTASQSANTVEGLKVVTDASGVGELATIAASLLNCSGLRLAFGRYTGSFGSYSANAITDFEGAFFTENMSEQALALFASTPTPPSSITPISITGTPSTPDPASVFFMATPEDPDVVDTLFGAYAGDPYFAGYLIAPEDS